VLSHSPLPLLPRVLPHSLLLPPARVPLLSGRVLLHRLLLPTPARVPLLSGRVLLHRLLLPTPAWALSHCLLPLLLLLLPPPRVLPPPRALPPRALARR